MPESRDPTYDKWQQLEDGINKGGRLDNRPSFVFIVSFSNCVAGTKAALAQPSDGRAVSCRGRAESDDEY